MMWVQGDGVHISRERNRQVTAGFVSRNALITGAGRDTGAAIEPSPAKVGADVILLAHTAEQLDKTENRSRMRSEQLGVTE
jgi:short-subunit dehydrogenase